MGEKGIMGLECCTWMCGLVLLGSVVVGFEVGVEVLLEMDGRGLD